MNTILRAFLLVAVALLSSSSAFTVKTHGHIHSVSASTSIKTPPTFTCHQQSLTSLQMVRVKIDPNAPKDDGRLNPAVFKNAAYLGSVVIALLLPLGFLLLKH